MAEISVNYADSLTGRHVIISTLEGTEILADTRIVEYNKNLHTIRIRTPRRQDIYGKTHVSVEVYTEDGISHYQGTVRKSVSMDSVEIALFQGFRKNIRNAQRYRVNAIGVIDVIWLEDQRLVLRKPMGIRVLNISAGGVMIAAQPGSFLEGMSFVLHIKLKEKFFSAQCQVMRSNEIDLATVQYGCQFIATASVKSATEEGEKG